MASDILVIFPSEIWGKCITYACRGDRYAANLLLFTSVSKLWFQLLTEMPTLWTNIQVDDSQEDCLATIAIFLHLSREAGLSLTVTAPLPKSWSDTLSMVVSSRKVVRKISINTNIDSHSVGCALRGATADEEAQWTLQHVLKSLSFPPSIRYLDVDLGRPCSMGSVWTPPYLVSSGNWLLSTRALGTQSTLCSSLRILSIRATNLVGIFALLTSLGQLQRLHLYSEKEDYLLPPPPPIDLQMVRIPSLRTLRYHGRLHWAPSKLLDAGSQTVEFLELHIGILDVEIAIKLLKKYGSLHQFSLTLLLLDYDMNDQNKRRTYTQRGITNLISRVKLPRWQLKEVWSFHCILRTFSNIKVPDSLDLDHLWHLFQTLFPKMRDLIWNLPVQSGSLFLSLVRQKQLRHFESNAAILPLSRQATGFTLGALETLRVESISALHGLASADVLYLSTSSSGIFEIPAGVTFMRLRSMHLDIRGDTKSSIDLSGGEFPALKIFSITFLGPTSELIVADFSSLAEISVSTRLPTFTQGMKFCVALMCEPWKCPRLEQVNLDSFLEYDVLYMLLLKRNCTRTRAKVSRIKRLRLSFLPRILRQTFASLLSGHIPPSTISQNLIGRLCIQETQSNLLNENVLGCFCCLQMGVPGCTEYLRPPSLTRAEINTSSANSEIVEQLGLFPLYDWGFPPNLSAARNLSADVVFWLESHLRKVHLWKRTALVWHESFQRTLVCHRQRCSPTTLLTEWDMLAGCEPHLRPSVIQFNKYVFHDPGPLPTELLKSEDPNTRLIAAARIATVAQHVDARHMVAAYIPHICTLLKNENWDILAAATAILTGLAVYTELVPILTDMMLPRIMTLLESQDFNVASIAVYYIKPLISQDKFRPNIKLAIPYILALVDNLDSQIREAAYKALEIAALYTDLRNAIVQRVTLLLTKKYSVYRLIESSMSSLLVRLAIHREFRSIISKNFSFIAWEKAGNGHNRLPMAVTTFPILCSYYEFYGPIQDYLSVLVHSLIGRHPSDTLVTPNILGELGKHANLQRMIGNALIPLRTLIQNDDTSLQLLASKALSLLAVYTDLQSLIEATIPKLLQLIHSEDAVLRLEALSILVHLAETDQVHNSKGPIVSSLFAFLKDEYPDIRERATSAISILVNHDDYHQNIQLAITDFIRSTERASLSHQYTAAVIFAQLSRNPKAQEFLRGAIRLLLRATVTCGSPAAEALATLAGNSEMRSEIAQGIPDLVKWATARRFSQRSSAATVLAALVANGTSDGSKVLIRTAIPHFVELLQVTENSIRRSAALALEKFGRDEEFLEEAKAALPALIMLLEFTFSENLTEDIESFVKLVLSTRSRDALSKGMPYLIGFIQGRYYGSSAASSIAASALVSLGSCTEFHNIVSAAIISIIKEMDRHVNLAGIDALIKLAALQTFQGTIRAIIPILVKLMRSKLSFKDKMEVALALDKLDVYQPTLDPKKELYHWVKFLGEDH